jgi:hypothetical protein
MKKLLFNYLVIELILYCPMLYIHIIIYFDFKVISKYYKNF